MTKNQNEALKMFELVSDFLDESPSTLLDGLPGFQECKTKFKSNKTKLRTQHELQTRNIVGFAVEKKEIRKHATDIAVDISNRIEAFALNTNNIELKTDMYYTNSSLSRMNENECISNLNNIHNRASSLLSELGIYGVNQLNLTEFKNSIDLFSEYASKTQSEINISKLATAEIRFLFSANMQLLTIMDVLVNMAKTEHPEFVKGYFESRNINLAIRRPYSIRFIVVDSQSTPLGGVLVSNELLDVRRRTIAKGVMNLKNIPEGTHEFTFSKVGYTTVKKDVDVNPSERNDEKIILTRV